MKKYIVIFIVAFLSISCEGQSKTIESQTKKLNPNESKGYWSVNKEFDEEGNLIRYDSTYYWSSDGEIEVLSSLDQDSLIQSFQSKFFSDLSYFHPSENSSLIFDDSLFSQKFFTDDFFESDFGKDYMDFDKMREGMISRHRRLFDKYNPMIDSNSDKPDKRK